MTFLSPPGIKGLIPIEFFDLRLISMAQIRRNKLDFKDTCKERKSLLRKMCQNTDFVRRICSCTRKYESEKALVQTNFVKWLTDSVITSNYCSGIVRKVSKYGVFLVSISPYSVWMQEKMLGCVTVLSNSINLHNISFKHFRLLT